jgi:hypothetical protein
VLTVAEDVKGVDEANLYDPSLAWNGGANFQMPVSGSCSSLSPVTCLTDLWLRRVQKPILANSLQAWCTTLSGLGVRVRTTYHQGRTEGTLSRYDWVKVRDI